MDDLEERLSRVLALVADQAAPAAHRLRNPTAGGPTRRRSGPGLPAGGGRGGHGGRGRSAPRAGRDDRTATQLGLPAATPLATQASSTPSTPADGRPEWALTPPATPASGAFADFAQLPVLDSIEVPTPYTLNPRYANGLVDVPTLVTADATVRFADPDVASSEVIAGRPRGIVVLTTGGDPADREGPYDAHVILIGPGSTPRVLYRTPRASHIMLSLDGATLTVATGMDDAHPERTPALQPVDTTSGRVTHHRPGALRDLAACNAWTPRPASSG